METIALPSPITLQVTAPSAPVLRVAEASPLAQGVALASLAATVVRLTSTIDLE